MDQDSGIVHTVVATPANVHDAEVTPQLLTGEEESVCGDSGYLGAEKHENAVVRNTKGKKIHYRINRRPSQIRKLSPSGQAQSKKAEHKKSSVGVKVEHVFAIIKGQFRHRKT